MLIDGEKWACEACVRGHRVSNCQHYDRPLQHINKKGRPVTQCQHCRSQRKNRSAHVKCDCGEKTNKCIHLGAIEGHRESCCCNHGGRCSCAFKNDLDTVPESADQDPEEAGSCGGGGEDDLSASSAKAALIGAASTAPSGSNAANANPSNKNPIRRRRANTTRSEGTLTFDEHGHHKPLSQKHTKAISQKTNPYPINRINSARSTGGLTNFLQASSRHDDEELDDNHSNDSDNGAEDTCSLEAAAAAAAATNCGTYLPSQLSQQRRSRSETASPLLFASSFPQLGGASSTGQLAPLNMGMVGYNTGFTNYNSFTPEQVDQPLFSAGLSAPSVDWSQFGLDFDRGFSTSTDDKFASAEAFGFTRNFGYEYNGSEQAPTMTTGTSGEVSEAEEPTVPGLDDYEYDYEYDGLNDAASGSIAFSRTNSSFHLPTAATSAPSVRANTVSSDINELRYLKAGNKFLPTPLVGASDDLATLQSLAGMPQVAGRDDDDSGLWMNDYQGLPSMTESPESDVISFWANK
ncbi:copper fist DNA-binding protein domain containing protein [Sporothrix brasiliensis 5110]|uniref:Copper fist DNA-binding protein domain containing protein n=1 Tax=Sporothrix brasiliensis 5110 TaxID=1398154 RepID=A0A0C2EXD1_9PEZI|nr:copper fist DNA-binding protein domain containing protein [Sporothrix brasiliensis 5110]KIH91249.1 copper fist DNA-binding protein domain containing protein [Sporothrix brasiliensis 5110]